MNSLTYHAGKFINDSDLNSPQAAQAHKSWELSKYSSKDLKDELASREGYIGPDNWLTIANSGVSIEEVKATNINEHGEPWNIEVLKKLLDTPEQHEICKHDMEMGYCEVNGCVGSY